MGFVNRCSTVFPVSVGEARGSWQTSFVIRAGSEGKRDMGLVRYFIVAAGILRVLAAFWS